MIPFDRILNLLLAAALVILLLRSAMDQPLISETSNSDKLAVIFARKSVRKYTETPVDKGQIETLLRAAMSAPSAQNKQPWSFVVIDDPALLVQLSKTSPYAGMVAKAPLAIVTCADSTRMFAGEAEPYWVQDCSAANENLLLAAEGLGLGAVWIGIYPIAERVEAVKQILKLPVHLTPLAINAIGYPAENPKPKDKWDPKKIRWNHGS